MKIRNILWDTDIWGSMSVMTTSENLRFFNNKEK